MTTLPHGFAQRYAAALASHLADAGEAALHEAYELGRQALDDALGVLAIAALHHDALGALVADDPVDDEEHRMAMAAEFLAECLSPFEMTLLGYREANLRLATLNERLQHANAETKAANEKLLGEMNERQRAEEALRQREQSCPRERVGRTQPGICLALPGRQRKRD